ncbi:hypothetical protein pb186bvf_014694 [Paramecium bursaria]
MFTQKGSPTSLKYMRYHRELAQIFQKKPSPLKIVDSKQRIKNSIQQQDFSNTPRERNEIIVSLHIQTQNMIVDRIKILEPTDKNQPLIEKNLQKLISIKEQFQTCDGNPECEALIAKVDQKLAEQDKLKKSDQSKCQICFDYRKEYVVIPCGHFIYCQKCKDLIKDKCLLCQQTVVQVLKIYQ